MSDNGDVVVRWKRSHILKYVVLSAVMALFSAIMTALLMTQSGPGTAGAAILVGSITIMFAVVTWLCSRPLSGDRIAAVVTEKGIQTGPIAKRTRFLEWSEVGEIALMEARPLRKTPRMVLIVPADPDRFLERYSRIGRARFRLGWMIQRVKWAFAFHEGMDLPLDHFAAYLAHIVGVPVRHI